jgi:hypothetical protein
VLNAMMRPGWERGGEGRRPTSGAQISSYLAAISIAVTPTCKRKAKTENMPPNV